MTDGTGAAVVVRSATVADAATAAALHADSIADGFLAALGPRFLSRLYRRIVLSPDAFLLMADGNGPDGGRSTAGFIAGALDLGALYRRFLLHDGVAATLTSLLPLARSWRLAFETLRHGTAPTGPADAGGDDSTADRPNAELLAVAVDPAWRGRHVGSLLVDGFLAELERRGVDRAQVVVGADNATAVALYRAHGFGSDTTFELHRGTRSLLLQRRAAAE